jgi:hypothetical protein
LASASVTHAKAWQKVRPVAKSAGDEGRLMAHTKAAGLTREPRYRQALNMSKTTWC